MRSLLCFILAFGLVAPTLATTNAKLTCGERFTKLTRDARREVTGGGVGESDFSNDKSIHISRRLPGRFGHDLLEVRRNDHAWRSGYSALKNAPQGDPRWMTIALGPEAAKFFGYSVESDKQAYIPSAEELTAAIRAFNDGLSPNAPERIEVSYYSSSKPQSPSREYLSNFVDRGALPVSPEETTRIHDLSWHSGAIFIPTEVLTLARRQAKATLDFVDYLKTRNPSWKEDPVLVTIIRGLLQHRTNLVDYGTGNIMFGITETGDAYNDRYILKSVFEDLVGKSPHRVVESGAATPAESLKQALLLVGARSQRSSQFASVMNELNEFIARSPKGSLDGSLPYSSNAFCDKVIERHQKLKARIAVLQGGASR